MVLFFQLSINCICFAQKTSHSQKDILSTKINIKLDSVSIKQVILALNKQNQVHFSYLNNDIPLAKIVRINFVNTRLDSILRYLFQGTYVKYYQVSKQIVLKLEEPHIEAKIDSVILPTPIENKLIIIKDTITEIKIDSTWYLKNSRGKYIFNWQKKEKEFKLDTLEITTYNDTIISSTDTLTSAKKTVKKRFKVRNYRNGSIPTSFHKLAVSVFINPMFSYRTLTSSSGNETTLRDKVEYGKLGFGGGISIQYYPFKNFFVESGIQYNSFGENGSYSGYYNRPPLNQGGQPIRKDTAIEYSNTYNYIGIPLCIGIKTNNRLSLGISTGIMFNYLISNSTNYPAYKSYSQQQPPQGGGGQQTPPESNNYYFKELDANEHQLNKLNYTFLLNIESGFRISQKLSILIKPTFIYSLSNLYKSTDVTTSKLYGFGLNFGITRYIY